jgi:PAS domain S-box-containing protein
MNAVPFPLVLRSGGHGEDWEGAVPEPRAAVSLASGVTDEQLRAASCVLIGARQPGALEQLRRLRRLDPSVQQVVVAEPDDRARLERGLLFTPGLGELWVVGPEEVGPALVERASAVTHQRRAHLRRTRQVEHALAALEPSVVRRASISDAYLAALLHALPDPIISVDAGGCVVSMNPAAERALGHGRSDTLRRPLAELVEVIDGGFPDFAALVGHTTMLRRALRYRRADGEEREGEVVVLPVDADGRRVYAVVVHDLTDERRAQHEVEAFAAELEAQAAEMQEVQAALESSHQELQMANERLVRRTAEAERARRETVGILNATSDAILGVDNEGLTTFANPAAERLLGWTAAEMIGHPQHDLIHHTRADGTPYPAADCPLYLARRAGEARHVEGEVFWRKDGTSFPVEYDMLPLLQDGTLAGAVVTFRDVTERRRAEAERERLLAAERAARAEAERANRTKSEFLANMSHELRTPINAVLGYTDLLEGGIVGPVTDYQREHLSRIEVSARHLLGLVEDILDLATLEAGRLEVVHEPGDAHTAVAESLPLILPQATAKGIVVENRCAAGRAHPYVGDADRVRQILVNLLSNAVKFTERGGSITVDVETARSADRAATLAGPGPWTLIRVTDTGIGIAPGQIEAIFHPFVQVETGHTRTRGGTGLGLTISREFARLMGGDLTARSVPGEGSAFTLWLPTGPAWREDVAATAEAIPAS